MNFKLHYNNFDTSRLHLPLWQEGLLSAISVFTVDSMTITMTLLFFLLICLVNINYIFNYIFNFSFLPSYFESTV